MNKSIKKFNVKNEQLTYSDFVSFITKAVNSLVIEDGIAVIAKEMIFKIYFANYYLDVELPEDETEAYEVVANINYEDYSNKIAWNQFLDLRRAFEDQCEKVEKYINKDISTAMVELIDNINMSISNFNANIKNIDINDTLNLIKDMGNRFNKITDKQVLDYAFNKLTDDKKAKKDITNDKDLKNKEFN